MNTAFAARIICDLTLWYCGAGLVLSLAGAAAVPLVPALSALCCVLSSLLSRKKAQLRFLPLSLLASAFFFIRGFADFLLYLPPLIYCAYICVRADFEPDYEGSASYFRTAAPALSAALLLVVIFGGAGAAAKVLGYFVVFLVSGVLMLRLLRHNAQNRREWRLQIIDLALLVLCCGAALFFSSGAFLGAAGGLLSLIYDKLIAPLLLALAYALSYVFLLFSGLFSIKGSEGYVLKLNSDNLDLKTIFGPEFTDETVQSRLPAQLLTALGIIAFLVAAFFVFRHLARGAGKRSARGAMGENVRRFAAYAPAVPFLVPARGAAETVRRCYRKFLLAMKSRGFTLSPSDTSESVLAASKGTFDPALAGELREIYIRARYSPASVTKADAKRAKELSAKLKISK